ncbi:MAG: hypothetical protein JF570_13865 [Caulobacter sp.]|nr:hypothetical protein [Caulobacter sp.]
MTTPAWTVRSLKTALSDGFSDAMTARVDILIELRVLAENAIEAASDLRSSFTPAA